MNLQEIIKENKYYQSEKEALELQLRNRKATVQSVNEDIDMDDIKLLPYYEAKSIHKLIYWNINKNQQDQLDAIVTQLKKDEYPQLTKAHCYPVINEMDFISDTQKVELDKLLSSLYTCYIYTGSSAWHNLKLNHDTTDKVLTFLHDKEIIEKSYVIKCDCGSSECDGRRISQQRYDEFVNFHKHSNGRIWEDDDDTSKGYIDVPCWNDGGKEIYELDTFMNEIELFSYKNITKPDTSLDEV